MKSYKEELQYEEKMDDISEKLEELVLDAILATLKKIKERNATFLNACTQSDEFPF